MMIEDADAQDASAIARIYNQNVTHGTALWTTQQVDAQDRAAWARARQGDGLPVLVARQGGVLGYASYGPWRPHEGYRQTVEHSVYVDRAAQGRGVARALMQALIARAQAAGLHTMVGAVEAGNAPSLALHRSLGFAQGGALPQVGQKFGRWLDLVFVVLVLGDGPPEGR